MRDSHRMREGIDLHLDNRQIVSFVIGSLVVLGVVFSLGVLVGKQLAAGALTATSQPGDPLAAIDAKEKVRSADSVVGIGDLPEARPDALNYQRELTRPTPAVPAAEPAAKKEVKEAKASEPAKEAKEAKAEPAPEKPAKAEPEEKREEPSRKEGLAAAFEKASGKAEGGSGGFTLQVASLPSRAEADKLVGKLSAKGLSSPHVVEADVPGKGRMYRVRVGSYATRADAEEGLKAFRKKSALPAIIANR